ncbi:MAG: Cytochrome c oxidase assembly protein cox11, mitochondrial, partial [Paramarteilia canceri]
GIASYDMLPPEAGLYFNKIQCFCFDEQLLKPQETIDMPLLFIVDPEFENEPALYKKDRITLAYKFFESHDGFEVPLPNFIKDL